MERKLDSFLLGKEMSNLESIVGYNSLLSAIKMIGEESSFTSLNPNFEGIDPDDGFSTVPYEKGFQFLCYLEEKVGEDDFKEIMGLYINKYKYKSVDWTDFKSVYEEYINSKYEGRKARKILNVIDWNKWVTEVGYPSQKIEFKSIYISEIENLIDKFKQINNMDNSEYDLFKSWHTNVKLVFLEKIYLLNMNSSLNKIVITLLKLIRRKKLLALN